MNLLEHYIQKIHSVKDISDDFEKHCGYKPDEPLLQVDLTYTCYGVKKRSHMTFWKSTFDMAKKAGYFMA